MVPSAHGGLVYGNSMCVLLSEAEAGAPVELQALRNSGKGDFSSGRGRQWACRVWSLDLESSLLGLSSGSVT